MAIVNKTAGTIIACPGTLQRNINNDANIVPMCSNLRVDDGTNITIVFDTALSPTEDSQLDTIISNLVCEVVTVQTTVDQITGSILPMTFSYGSKAANKWLSYPGDKSIPSDATHGIMPFDCKLVGIVFSNEHDTVDTDIEIHVSGYGQGNTANVLYAWPLRATRTARRTTFPSEILFSAGDKLGIYCKHKKVSSGAEKPNHPAVTLYLQITMINTEDQYENFSDEF